MPDRTLTVRGVPDATLRQLRAAAAANHRSLNGELLAILEQTAEERRQTTAKGQVGEPAPAPYAARPARATPPTGGLKVDREALAAVCRRFHIRRLALFGSHARGEARPDSDVDLLVDFEPGMTPGLGIVAVADALGNALGGRRVDLVTGRGLRSGIRDRVLAEAVPLHGN